MARFINGVFNTSVEEVQSLNGTISYNGDLTGSIMHTILKGVGIKSIEQVVKTEESSGENIWNITLTNGTIYSLSVFNGTKGKDGKDGYTPYITENYTWGIGDIDTGIKISNGDYNDLVNKPSINDVELNGNMSLEELGFKSIDNYIKVKTKEEWDNDANYIPSPGEIIIYTNYSTKLDEDGNEVDIPSIKIGNGVDVLSKLEVISGSNSDIPPLADSANVAKKLEHSITIGEHVFDGSEDVTISVYSGEVNNDSDNTPSFQMVDESDNYTMSLGPTSLQMKLI